MPLQAPIHEIDLGNGISAWIEEGGGMAFENEFSDEVVALSFEQTKAAFDFWHSKTEETKP